MRKESVFICSRKALVLMLLAMAAIHMPGLASARALAEEQGVDAVAPVATDEVAVADGSDAIAVDGDAGLVAGDAACQPVSDLDETGELQQEEGRAERSELSLRTSLQLDGDGQDLQGASDQQARMVRFLPLAGDEIGFMAWVELPEGFESAGDGYSVVFEVSGKAHRTVEVAQSDAVVGEGRLRGFACPLSVAEMADPVTVKLSKKLGDGEVVLQSEEHCLRDCLREAIDNNLEGFNHNTLKAMADMGHYTQPFFAEINRWSLGSDHREMDLFYTRRLSYGDSEHVLRKHEGVVEIDKSRFSKVTCSLVFGPRTTMKLYLTPREGVKVKGRVTFNGDVFRPERQSDGRYLISVPDIAPGEFDRELVCNPYSEIEGADIHFSPYSYLKRLWSAHSDNKTYTDAIASIVAYNEAHA